MTFYAPAAHERQPNDHYPTPPDLAQALPRGLALAGVPLSRAIYDPCCGDGALLDALGGVIGTDLYPDLYSGPLVDASDPDALEEAKGIALAIVTNPPYGRKAEPIVRAGVRLVERGTVELAAFLVPLPWESAGGRSGLMRSMTLRIVPCWRSVWVPGTKGGGKMNYVWLVWTDTGTKFPVTIYLNKPPVEHDL